jgi:alpha-glucosidase
MGTHVVAFARDPRFLCVVNTGAEPLPLPWGELLLASDPVFDGGELPTDTAAWLRTP